MKVLGAYLTDHLTDRSEPKCAPHLGEGTVPEVDRLFDGNESRIRDSRIRDGGDHGNAGERAQMDEPFGPRQPERRNVDHERNAQQQAP